MLDFGAAGSAVSSGHHLVTSGVTGSVEVIGNNLTFGENVQSGDLLKRDWMSGDGNGRIVIRVPHGVWTVNMTLGNDDNSNNGVDVTTPDYMVRSNLYVVAGANVQVLFTDLQEDEIIINLETEDSWSIRSIELSNGQIAIDPGASSYSYDFGRIKNPVESGFVGISGNSWGDVFWSTPVITVQDYITPLRGVSVDVAYNGLYTGGIANIGMLSHKLPNGVWNLDMTACAAHFAVVDMAVYAEGNLIRSGINTAAESTYRFNEDVTVTDGVLNLEFQGTAWGVAFMRLTKVADVIGPDSLDSGATVDDWRSNLVINETDSITNFGLRPMLVNFDRFRFNAGKVEVPLTPFVVKVNADNDFTVVAVGETRTDYSLGYNAYPFGVDLHGGGHSVLLASGDTLAFGFLDANAGGADSTDSVVSFDLGGKEIYYSGGLASDDSGSVVVGQAPILGLNTITNLQRDYKFAIDYSTASLGSQSIGLAVTNRAELGSWKSSLVIDKTNRYINNTEHTSYVHPKSFSFYAAQITSPVTPIVIKIEGWGIENYKVVAIGDTIESYQLGENTVQFSSSPMPPVVVEPDGVLAFGFINAHPDGSGATPCPIPFDTVSETENAVIHSGGPWALHSAKLALWAAFVPGDTTYANQGRAYSFKTYFDVTSAQLFADAEDANISVDEVLVGSPGQLAQPVPNYDTLVSKGIRPRNIVRENAHANDGPPPYSTASCRVTSDHPRQGNHALLFEILAMPGEGKQRCEFKLGSFDWDIDDPTSGYYHAFSFRFDSQFFGNPGSRFFTLNQITQSAALTGPGYDGFHQVNKLQLRTSTDPSRVKLISQTLYGNSVDYPFSYQGQENTYEVAEIEKDVWYDIIIGSRYDLNGDGGGFLNIWLKKASETEYTAFNGAPNGRVGFVGGSQVGGKSLGVYKGFDNQRYRIYYDEIRQGPLFSDVDIRQYPNLSEQVILTSEGVIAIAPPSDLSMDSDNDSLPDFLEYALGYDVCVPNLSPSYVLINADDSRHLVFREASLMPGFDYDLEYSTNLIDWDSVGGAPAVMLNPDGSEEVVLRMNSDVTSAEKVFMRLSVSHGFEL
ncbi:heparin lyase I family protein [Rubellicoccus peritrichatus]|uniref:Uncharacterized protein n=1 Tax=Rubellicoccus peritrichatus TaxID=3080537 RepID=A0AAQ3LGR0_9BACT|nr:hypothetical protein [Puniceicoccus sp. CR14]WOO43585.1 hypothetical protein RZN69_10845 [Puniceicoccus sp. CR14]